MEKQRKYKVFVVVALIFTIVALSVAFAAFSKVLTINASATVTPNEEDFKVVTYGLKDIESFYYFDGYKEFLEEHLSNEKSVGNSFSGNNDVIGTEATITNDKNSTTISNINVTFNKESSSYMYYFIIRNEGKYDAYLNLKDFEYYDASYKAYHGICTMNTNSTITQEQLNTICEEVYITISMLNTNFEYVSGTEEEPYYKLSTGDYIWIEMYIEANKGTMIPESYNVDFEDITLNFSTAPYKN